MIFASRLTNDHWLLNRVKANEYSYVINYANGGTIVVYRKSISILCISYVIIDT